MSEPSASGPPAGRKSQGGFEPKARAALREGDRLAGRFRVLRLLGTGGTGEVYEAEDAELGERVALKLLRPELAEDEALLQRFKREVHLARQVTHPNVCRLHDLVLAEPPKGRRKGNPSRWVLVSMELLAGESLAERLARTGPFSPAEALPIVRQAAEGLDAAHRARVVHRDFKSGNVMLVPEGVGLRAVVTDFGLARADSSEGAEVDSVASDRTTLTQIGTIVGSPAYMAPEQVRGEVATPASDVFAFGVVLYEMVTGHLPFEGGGAFQTALRRLSEEPKPPSAWRPDLDPRWERTILTCLAREPGGRPATAGAVVRALDGEASALAVPPPTPRKAPRWRGWRRAAAALALALGLAAGGWLAFRPQDRNEQSARAIAEGLAALRRFDAPAAHAVLERASRADPQNPRIPWALAPALSLLGHEREALAAARRAFELSSGLPEAERWEIEARYRGFAGESAAEIALYQKLFRAERNLEHGLALGNAQVAGQQPEGAAATLLALEPFRRSPNGEPRIDLLAASLGSATGNWREQLRSAQRAAEGAERLGAPLLGARASFFVANAERQLGHLDAALATAEASRAAYAAGKNPAGEALAWKEIGAVRRIRGDLAGALQAFDRTIDLASRAGWQSGFSYGLNGRAVVLRKMGRLAEAAQTFDRLLELQRELSDARGEAASRSNAQPVAAAGRSEHGGNRVAWTMQPARPPR